MHNSLLHLLLKNCDFLNTDISQGSVATHLVLGGVFKYSFVTNFLLNLSLKEFWKSVNIWWSYGQEFGVLFFLRHSVVIMWQVFKKIFDFCRRLWLPPHGTIASWLQVLQRIAESSSNDVHWYHKAPFKCDACKSMTTVLATIGFFDSDSCHWGHLSQSVVVRVAVIDSEQLDVVLSEAQKWLVKATEQPTV